MSSAENQIALLRRCQPLNGPSAGALWLAAFRRGEDRPVEWEYAPPTPLGELRRQLEAAALALAREGPVAALYAARAAELELEARLAERVGHAEFRPLARQRHREQSGPEWGIAHELALTWASEPEGARPGPLSASDDRDDPESLVSLLLRDIGQRRLPVRVQIVSDLGSRAACGDGVIFIRAGVPLSAVDARRIAVHELLGHALPRVLARAQPLGLLRVGSARSVDDEEGRALWIEEQHGVLDGRRRAELGRRHLTACAVARGASARECVESLLELGCELDAALALYTRVARGGGLCRELEYLPAWLRYKSALGSEPSLAAWLSHGRISLAAARVLCASGVMRGAALDGG